MAISALHQWVQPNFFSGLSAESSPEITDILHMILGMSFQVIMNSYWWGLWVVTPFMRGKMGILINVPLIIPTMGFFYAWFHGDYEPTGTNDRHIDEPTCRMWWGYFSWLRRKHVAFPWVFPGKTNLRWLETHHVLLVVIHHLLWVLPNFFLSPKNEQMS